METAEFAELLRDVLLADAMNGETDTFNCIVTAVQSAQQQQVCNQYFQKWLDKNVVSGEEETMTQSIPAMKTRSSGGSGTGGRPVVTDNTKYSGLIHRPFKKKCH